MAGIADVAPAGAVPAKDGRSRSWRSVYADGATFVGRGMLAGLVCGALIGGVGGRLAMLLLRLTSDVFVRGLESDDGFTIGAVTAATFFLIFLTALLGALGGLLYLVVRGWLPPRWRPLVFGLLGATVGGALVIVPDGVDFTLLEPRWLAVALFVALPAAYGVALSLLAERLLRPDGGPGGRWRWLAVLPFVLTLATGPIGVAVLLPVGLLIGVNRSGALVRLWRSASVVWLGRGAVAAALGIGGTFLVRDIVAVL
jgi:hypothetical protein